MTVDEYFPLKEKMGDIDVVFEQEYFLEQRMVKDAEEIACTKAAIAAAEAGFDKLLPRLKTGMTEKDLADELHYLVSKEGAEAMSFGTIVGSGARGALAHAFPTSKNRRWRYGCCGFRCFKRWLLFRYDKNVAVWQCFRRTYENFQSGTGITG